MKKIMVFGTFDALHPGHLNFFQQAKKLGGYLIVVVARDKTVKKVKRRLPHNSELDRRRLVSALRPVDSVLLGSPKSPMSLVKKIKPDIVCLGYDQRSFVPQLKTTFPKLRIVRLRSYKPRYYKSSKMRIKS